jgi:N-acetylglucosamine-6-sulfatase
MKKELASEIITTLSIMNFFWFVVRLSLLSCAAVTGAQNVEKRPNIVFILTDDQDMRMNSLEHMQKVQNLLIAEGTSYKRHYAPTALCCPARVSILTGLHAHNHLVTDVNGVGLDEFPLLR